jgi:hypothetical protein
MNSTPHEAAWRDWSSGERARLLTLSRAELLLAVQTGGLDNLVEEDAKAVLAALAGFKDALPTVLAQNSMVRTIRATGRQPEPFTCNSLAIGPRITVLMWLRKYSGGIAMASACLLWLLVFILGNHWLLQNSAVG